MSTFLTPRMEVQSLASPERASGGAGRSSITPGRFRCCKLEARLEVKAKRNLAKGLPEGSNDAGQRCCQIGITDRLTPTHVDHLLCTVLHYI